MHPFDASDPFDASELDLPSAIARTPDAGTSSDASPVPPVEVFDEIVIRLRTQNDTVRIEMNGQAIEGAEALEKRVAEILQIGVQPPVIVDPDPEVAMSDAVKIYDLLRFVGVDRVLFAAKAEASID